MKPVLTPEGKYQYDYPHAAITADCVIFGFDGTGLRILLIERGADPYKGMWALPGGFMKVNDLRGGHEDSSIEETARRELFEETGLKDIFMEQFRVYSASGRDPRERVITVAFIGLVRPELYQLIAGDDASNAMWWNIEALPPLAFDHYRIISEAREYLAEIIRIRPIAFNLLEKAFTMPELQKVYEAISGQSYDRRNFQRKALQTQMVVPTEELPEYECVSASVCNDAPEDSGSQPEALRPRRGRRLFSFLAKHNDSHSDDPSIKDIFNW